MTPGAGRSDAERLKVLSEALTAFAETTGDYGRLLDTIVALIGRQLGAFCSIALVSDDSETLMPVASFDRDPEALAFFRAVHARAPLRMADPHPATDAVRTGVMLVQAKVDVDQLRRQAPPAHHALLERFAPRSSLHCPLRAGGKSIGLLVIVRRGPDATPFDESDLELATNLAHHAALAVTNARSLELARSMAHRLQALSQTTQQFSAAAREPHQLLQIAAERLSEMIGEVCGIRLIEKDGVHLEPTALVHHPDAALRERFRGVLSLPQKVGEGLSGRVAATGERVLIPAFDTAALPAEYQDLDIGSLMVVPMKARGQTLGIVVLTRGRRHSPFTTDDALLVQELATHAALAIENGRLFEEAARELAERRKADRRFSRLSEAGLLGVIAGTFSRRVVEINDTLLQMVGYTRDEVLSGKVEWASLTPPEWREGDTRAVDQLKATGIGPLREKEYLRKDGTRVPVLIGSALIDAESGESVSFVLDLTERKRAEAAIERLNQQRESDRRFRNLLDAAPDAMVIVGEDGRIRLVNDQVERLFGYTRGELIGQSVELLVPARFRGAHPGHRAGYLGASRLRPMGVGLDLRAVRKDGSEFPAEVSLAPMQDEQGTLVTAAIRDITDRKQLEVKLVEANRLKSEFLANMSHELRTPLNAIIGFTEFIHRGKAGPVNADQVEYLGDVMSSAKHLLQVLNDVLDLSKVEAGKMEMRPEEVDVGKVVREVCDVLRGMGHTKRQQTVVQVEVPSAFLDPSRFKQILYNYLSNAIKFTGEGGRIAVRVLPEGDDELRLDVEDTGIGIAAESFDKLFVEFQQLDASAAKKYQGTGLGLALTKRLVEAQGGRVALKSTLGVGSTFSAILPRLQRAA